MGYDSVVRLAVAFVVLCGCGRIGFMELADDQPPQDAPPDAGPGTVRVEVTGGALDGNAGEPIADAYVVFVAADGMREVARTDASGIASTFVTGATTVHVAYEATPAGTSAVLSPVKWRVTSYAQIGGGTVIQVGAPAGFGGGGTGDTITVNLPALAGATEYWVIGPGRCGIDGTSITPSFTQWFEGRCNGDPARLYAAARTPTSTSWLDAGDVTLAPGAVISPTASWQPAATYRIRIDGIADGTSVNAGLLEARGTEDALEIGYDEVASVGGTAMLAFDGPAVPVEQIRGELTKDAGTSLQLVRAVAPPDVAGTRSLDPGLFSTAIESLIVDPQSAAMQWTYGPPTQTPGVVVASFEVFDTPGGEQVEWFGYHPVATTSSVLPELPAPLDTLRPAMGATIQGIVMLVDLGGGDYAQAVTRIDRDFSSYLMVSTEIPVGAAASVRIIPGKTARVAPRVRYWIDRMRGTFSGGG